MRQFFCRFLQMLLTAATIEVSVFLAMLTCWHVQFFENICFPSFLRKLTSISRQNWSCEEIPSSQNSDKAASFSAVVVNKNIASNVWKLTTVDHFAKITLFTHHEVFSYLQNHQLWDILVFKKSSYSAWQNTQFTTAILFCFIFTAQRGEYNVIVRDSEPIRLLESPRSLSVCILITNNMQRIQ